MKCDEKWRERACGDQNDLCDLRDRLVAEQYFETLRHAEVTLCAGKCPWFTGVSGHLRENRQCATLIARARAYGRLLLHSPSGFYQRILERVVVKRIVRPERAVRIAFNAADTSSDRVIEARFAVPSMRCRPPRKG